MRGSRLSWLLVALLASLHLLLRVGLGLGSWAPDLMTLALLIGARHVGLGAGAGMGFAFGLLEDAFSILAFGANTVAMTVVGALGARTRDLFVGESVQFFLWYLAIGKWIRDLIHWALTGDSVRGAFVQQMLVDGSIAAAYAAAVGTLILVLLGAVRESAT